MSDTFQSVPISEIRSARSRAKFPRKCRSTVIVSPTREECRTNEDLALKACTIRPHPAPVPTRSQPSRFPLERPFSRIDVVASPRAKLNSCQLATARRSEYVVRRHCRRQNLNHRCTPITFFDTRRAVSVNCRTGIILDRDWNSQEAECRSNRQVSLPAHHRNCWMSAIAYEHVIARAAKEFFWLAVPASSLSLPSPPWELIGFGSACRYHHRRRR